MSEKAASDTQANCSVPTHTSYLTQIRRNNDLLAGMIHAIQTFRGVNMITGLTHTAISVTDVEGSIRFYCDILGLTEHFRLLNDDGTTCLVYLRVAPSQFIELFPGAEAPHEDSKAAGVVHICLEVDDIHETHREMTSRGLTGASEPFLAGDNSWQFWTRDPDGNPIEFHQFTPESMQKEKP
jgi:lactoylglutathione lyase